MQNNFSERRILRAKSNILLLALLCLFLGIGPAFGYGENQKSSDIQNLTGFRYVIVGNYALHNGRVVSVLIDPKAFSEANLRELFALLSKRFPEPDQLHVGAYTNLQQLPTPEEEDHAKSVPNASFPFFAEIDKYPGASYARSKGNEAFQYSMADGQPEKTVIIKGKNPFQ